MAMAAIAIANRYNWRYREDSAAVIAPANWRCPRAPSWAWECECESRPVPTRGLGHDVDCPAHARGQGL
eukprot:scaffold252564_cov31-Tisochrysis_lutea.AAC.2